MALNLLESQSNFTHLIIVYHEHSMQPRDRDTEDLAESQGPAVWNTKLLNPLQVNEGVKDIFLLIENVQPLVESGSQGAGGVWSNGDYVYMWSNGDLVYMCVTKTEA